MIKIFECVCLKIGFLNLMVDGLHTHIHVHTSIYIYICIQVYSYLYVWVCVSMHVCIKWPIEYPSIGSMETCQEPFFISHLFDAGHIVSRHTSTADSHSEIHQ